MHNLMDYKLKNFPKKTSRFLITGKINFFNEHRRIVVEELIFLNTTHLIRLTLDFYLRVFFKYVDVSFTLHYLCIINYFIRDVLLNYFKKIHRVDTISIHNVMSFFFHRVTFLILYIFIIFFQIISFCFYVYQV